MLKLGQGFLFAGVSVEQVINSDTDIKYTQMGIPLPLTLSCICTLSKLT